MSVERYLPASTAMLSADVLDATMPIDIEEFESAPVTELRQSGEPTNQDAVLAFLSDHAEAAFTPVEIRAETGVPRGSVCVVLSRLEDRGLVRHRGEYWAAAAGADETRETEETDETM